MSFWEVKNRGFLSSQDPLSSLVIKDEKYIPAVARLENISSVLPYWIEDRKVREELVSTLRDISPLLDANFLLNQNEATTERLMHLFSYMASAYVFAEYECPANRIPSEIAVPLTKIAEKLSRKPIISYTDGFLTNWEKIDQDEPIEFDNLKSLSNFTSKSHESDFVAFNIELEAAAADGISSCCELIEGSWSKQNNQFNVVMANDILTKIFVSLSKMNKSIKKFKEKHQKGSGLGCQCGHLLCATPRVCPICETCTSEIYKNYFLGIQKYTFSLVDIIFEGCFYNKPVTISNGNIRPPSPQSCVFLSFLTALELSDKFSEVQQLVGFYEDNSPVAHREFIKKLCSKVSENVSEGFGLRDISKNEATLKEIYNECVTELSSLLASHPHYCVNQQYTNSFYNLSIL
jgi:hypothetical protein